MLNARGIINRWIQIQSRFGASALLVALLCVVMVLGSASVYYITNQANVGKRYLTVISDMQLMAQEITTYALEAASGKESAFLKLVRLRDRFTRNLAALRSGDPAASLPPLPADVLPVLGVAESQWSRMRKQIDAIVSGREAIMSARDHARWIADTMPALVADSQDRFAEAVAMDADPRSILLSAEQPVLAERIKNQMAGILAGDQDAAEVADKLAKNLRTLLSNRERLDGLHALEAAESGERDQPAPAAGTSTLYGQVNLRVTTLLKILPKLFAATLAKSEIEASGAELVERTRNVEASIVAHDQRLGIYTGFTIGLGTLSIILLFLIAYLQIRDARRRMESTARTHERNQEAILNLLDEMSTLAEGDLTVSATVSEDFTGAIADSVNFAIDAMRSLVSTINESAENISKSTDKTRDTTKRLSAASNYQTKEIAAASTAISEMAQSIKKVSSHALKSSEVAKQSVSIAHKGTETVGRTIEGMGVIREQIQETSKRIKRLGESSQEIGDIVSLIDDIADQTNILALNAAIQASTAGEAGKGFAVVADEVQRLAERARNATKQIEGLVKTIQADTNEAVISMEQSTANVVSGAGYAEDAGQALGDIETVSMKLASLIQIISQAARQQSAAAANIANNMNVIQEITMQTAEGTKDTVASVDLLTGLSASLRDSVAGFKLPESEEVASVPPMVPEQLHKVAS